MAELALGVAPLALLLGLADAQDRQQAGVERGRHLQRQRLVGLAEQLAPLGVAEDRRRATPSSSSIGARDLAGERALGRVVHVLGVDLDARAARRVDHRRQRGERRADRDVDAVWSMRRAAAAPAMNSSASATVLCIFQLPAISGAAARSSCSGPRRPGSVRALDQLERGAAAGRDVGDRGRRARTAASAAAESPPPTTVTPGAAARPPRRPRACRRRTASSSNAPIGPFQNTVPAVGDRRRRRPARCAGRCRGPSCRRARRRRRAVRGVASAPKRSRDHEVDGQRQRRPRVARTGGERRAGELDVLGARTARRRPRGPGRRGTGKHIAPPIRIVSATCSEALDHADLVADLRAAEHRDERPGGVLEQLAERASPPARAGGRRHARAELRDALGRGVRAVRGAERVVDVDVGRVPRAPRASSGSFLVSPGSKRTFSSSSTSPGAERVGERRDLVGPTTAGASSTAHAEQLAQPLGRPAPATARARGPSGARGARRARARRRARAAASIVGSAARIRVSSATAPSVERDVEVDADEHPLAPQVTQVVDASSQQQLHEVRRRGWSSPTRCRTRRRP